LSNLAFLDLSDDERDSLKARYHALNPGNEVSEEEPNAEDIIGYLDPMILD